MSGDQNNGGMHRPQPVPVPLSKPIKAHGRDMSELTLLPLTGKDLRIYGAPFKVGMRGEEGIVDTQAMSSLTSELASVPISSVDQLAGVDWFACWSVIQGFFGHDQRGRPLDGDAILAAYFDAGAFWGDIEHVMSLTLPELQLYLRHAIRIRNAAKQS